MTITSMVMHSTVGLIVERVQVDELITSDILHLYDSDSTSTPYCHPLWIQLLGTALQGGAGYYIATRSGRMVGALPYIRRPLGRLPFSLDQSLPHDCYCFPLLDSSMEDAEKKEIIDAIYRSMFEHGNLIRLYPPGWIEFDVHCLARSLNKVAAVVEVDIFLKSLSGISNQIQLLGSYHDHHRRQVKIALKSTVSLSRADSIEDLTVFYDLLTETMARAGRVVKFPFDTIVSGGKQLIKQGLGTLYLARFEGVCCAGAFVLRSKRVVCYWLGASTSDKQALNNRPMFALFHAALQDAITDGAEYFDFGAGPTQGLRDFKQKWGAKPIRQPMYTVARREVIKLLKWRDDIRRIFCG